MPTPNSDPSARRVKSTLNPVQRGFLLFGFALAILLLANTLYLLANRAAEATGWGIFAVTDTSLPLWYQVMVLSHTGLGLVVAGLAAVFVLWHLPAVWKRHRVRTVATGIVAIASLAALAVSGLFILTAAASRQHAWVWWLHVGLAALLPISYLLHRVWSFRPPIRPEYRSFGAALAAVTAVVIGVHFVLPRGVQKTPEALARESLVAARVPGSAAYLKDPNNFSPDRFHAAADVPEESVFFPAAATTTTGGLLPRRILIQEYDQKPLPKDDFDKYGFVVNAKIGAEGCERCHQDIVAQWEQSAHRFSSFNNPFYEASINFLREHGTIENEPILRHMAHLGIPKEKLPLVRSKWCSSCHDPALMIPGQMTEVIDRRSVEAQTGLTCLACHNIDSIHNTTGNGNYNQQDEQESPYLFARTFSGWARQLHDFALKARPAVHKRQMLKPLHKTSEFCSTCHKVSLDVPLNTYRWVRGQNEYDGWHDSGIAHNASRTFYLPPNKRQCQDCHMPLEPAPLGDVAAKGGMVKSHRFLAVNNALPFIRGDEDAMKRVEQFLQNNQLRIDVAAVVQPEGEQAGTTVYLPHVTRPVLPPERPLRFEVVVRNLNVGHTFPGGTNDSNESWVEFTVLDEQGRELVRTGVIRPDGHLEDDAHTYRLTMIDRNGERVFRRDPHNFVAPVYVNLIGPGTADVVHYELTPGPALAGKKLTVRARLLWRKFDRGFTEFAYETNREAFARFDRVPELPVIEICRTDLTLDVGTAEVKQLTAREATIPESDWMRINDYGIGLLLEGNTRGAREAFARVAEVAPKRADGFRNVARAAHAEGALPAAYEAIRRAEELEPGDARTAWVWGQVLAEDGRYAEAAAAFRRALQVFPDDRGSWRELAIVLYRDQQFEESLKAGAEVLRIDPEDRVAHYYKMLALRALGRTDEAKVAQAAYEKYQIDESAQEITRLHRLRHEGDNRESQAIHVHYLRLDGVNDVARSGTQ